MYMQGSLCTVLTVFSIYTALIILIAYPTIDMRFVTLCYNGIFQKMNWVNSPKRSLSISLILAYKQTCIYNVIIFIKRGSITTTSILTLKIMAIFCL